MRNFPQVAWLTVLVLIAIPSAGVADTGVWEAYGGENGVQLWRKRVEGSSLIAFRGETEIPASLAKVSAVLYDVDRRTEWMADATDCRELRVISRLEKVEYNRTRTPWPLQDRDFVYRTLVEVDRAPREIRIFISSVEDPSMPPRDGVVRGRLMSSSYVLTETPDRKSTRVKVEIHADPQGAVPTWASNWVQKNWPQVTLDGIRRQAAKSDVKEDEQLVAYFEKGITPDWAKSSLASPARQ